MSLCTGENELSSFTHGYSLIDGPIVRSSYKTKLHKVGNEQYRGHCLRALVYVQDEGNPLQLTPYTISLVATYSEVFNVERSRYNKLSR